MAFGLFKKKKDKKSGDNRFMTLQIKEVVNIARDAVNLVFEKPDEDFQYQPGQFITLIDTVDGKKIRRAYSLNSTPFEDEYPAVTVKRVKEGILSNHINDAYTTGQEVQIMEPMGLFTIDYDADKETPAVFIGGGSGITPLISLIRSILIKEPKRKIALLYANRSEEYIIFKDKLEQLAEQYSDRLTVKHVLETEEGRPTPAMINDWVKEGHWQASEFFICGPQPMMDVVKEGLNAAGVSAGQMKMESFEAGKTSPKTIIADESEDSQVTIILDDEEYDISVPANRNILEVGLDEGIDMPYSCQSGMCTACRGKCLEGDVTTDEVEGLSQEELDEGYRLLCIGKPIGDKLRIEIG